MNILDKLKKKFLLISTSLVGAVLLIIFLGIFLYSYKVIKTGTDDYLDNVVSELLTGGEIYGIPFFLRGDNRSQPTFVYEFDDESKFIASNINMKLKDDVFKRVKDAIDTDKSLEGYVLHEEFKYKLVKTNDEKYILFLVNISPQIKMVKLLGKSLLSSFVLTMIIIGFISKYLIDKALQPVEETWRDQKQFIADASHELKTPLTVILANLKILKKYENYDKNQIKWIYNTELETRRMKDLVEEMLFLAKRDSGNMTLKFEEVNFSELVEEVALTFESIAFENDLNIVFEEKDKELKLEGDRNQLKRLIIIFIDNACKYAKPHSDILIELVNRDKKIKFSVTSMGPPIDEECAKKIFDRFVRESKSRSRDSQGGYGLGLAIAKSITESHNGKIYWRNFEDKGNTFVVELPL